MKIELKNTDFKILYEWLENHSDISTPKVGEIIHEQLKNQYDKAFNKYQNEKQEFEVGERVQFKWPRGEWWNGEIKRISRRADGKYTYVVKYDKEDEFDRGETNPLTKKNIRKIK